MQNEWEFFFDRHAPRYMDEPFTKNTEEEIEFIVTELGLPTGSRILDVGCGSGRHSIGLAHRGYKMAGVDISSGMLSQASQEAEKAGVKIELIHADAVDYVTEGEFDAAICICEGAFGLLGSSEDPHLRDLRILRNINTSLKTDGRFILTALNGMMKIREASPDSITEGIFEPLTLTEVFELDYEDESGPGKVVVRERGFVPSELVMMLQVAGFVPEHIWGGTAGSWKRENVALDEIEIMAVARKTDRNPASLE